MTDTSTQLAVAPAATAVRFDMYTTIHKALRQFMGETLVRVGAMDVTDADDRARTLDGLDALLQQLRSHLQHENAFVHAAIEARRPGAARQTADDHALHLEAIANLEDQSRALRHIDDAHEPQRAALALRLYRHLAAFVAENLEHMQVEEIVNNAALWALYSDDELHQIHGRLLASITPAEMMQVARWMSTALNAQELALLYGGMQAMAPKPAFDALLDVARARLDDTRWAKLARALGLPPVPGLVTA